MLVLENRILRRIFQPKWGEITENWRIRHNYKFHNFWPNTGNEFKEDEMDGTCSTHAREVNTVFRSPKICWNRLRERLGRRRESNSNIYLKYVR
jgi:hypothetical protein